MGTAESKLEDVEVDTDIGGRTYELDVLQDHAGAINCMAVSDDGSILATGSDDNTIRLWMSKSPRCDCIGILAGHDNYITCVVIEGILVISASVDKTIRKWDMATCVCLAVLRGHEERINRLISVGDFVFSSSMDATIRCWDLDDGRCIREFAGHQNSVFPLLYIPVDEDEEDQNNTSLEGTENTLDLQRSASPTSSPPGAIFSAGMKISDILISGSTDCTARSWSFEKGCTMHVFSGHTGPVTCLGIDADARVLVTGSTDGTVRSWDINVGSAIRVFEAHSMPVVCMVVVDKMVITGSSDSTACAFLLNSFRPPTIYSAHKKTVICMKAADGMLFTGSSDGSVFCWNIANSCIKRKFIAPPNSVVSAMQVVGNRLYTGSTDGTLRIWTLKGLKPTETSKQSTDTETAADADDDVARQRNAAEQ